MPEFLTVYTELNSKEQVLISSIGRNNSPRHSSVIVRLVVDWDVIYKPGGNEVVCLVCSMAAGQTGAIHRAKTTLGAMARFGQGAF